MRSKLREILPHRYPFLLVDRITECEPDKKRPVSNASVSMSRISAAIFPATP